MSKSSWILEKSEIDFIGSESSDRSDSSYCCDSNDSSDRSDSSYCSYCSDSSEVLVVMEEMEVVKAMIVVILGLDSYAEHYLEVLGAQSFI